MKAFADHDDCETVALCDVDSNALAKAAGKAKGTTFQTGDSRELITVEAAFIMAASSRLPMLRYSFSTRT